MVCASVCERAHNWSILLFIHSVRNYQSNHLLPNIPHYIHTLLTTYITSNASNSHSPSPSVHEPFTQSGVGVPHLDLLPSWTGTPSTTRPITTTTTTHNQVLFFTATTQQFRRSPAATRPHYSKSVTHRSLCRYRYMSVYIACLQSYATFSSPGPIVP